MPSMIRLRRVGRNKQSNYRVVVVDQEAPRDGAYIEAIGFYNPRSKPAELRLDLGRFDAWVAKGAQMSDTVASLARKARRGGDRTVEIVPVGGRPPKAEAPAAAPAAKPARSRSRAAAASAPAVAAEPAASAPAVAAEPADAPPAVAAEPAASAPAVAAEPADAPPAAVAEESGTAEA